MKELRLRIVVGTFVRRDSRGQRKSNSTNSSNQLQLQPPGKRQETEQVSGVQRRDGERGADAARARRSKKVAACAE